MVVQPLVQINIPMKYLSLIKNTKPKMREQQTKDKLDLNLLLHSDRPILRIEPDNSPSKLLAALQFIKFKQRSLMKEHRKK